MAKNVLIRELFERPIDRQIEEVIKVDQSNEDTVYDELTEYVVTDSIRDSFIKVLERFSETPNHPHEGVGVWVSGFFGSGKSSFAKILGYVLEGRRVKGKSATDLFLQRTTDQKLKALAKTINEKIPTKAVILDLATDLGVKSGSEHIAEVIYKALLRSLGYSDDLDLAELEIALEQDGELETFERRFKERYGQPWSERRGLIAFSINQASTILHEMHPDTYPAADSWAKAKPSVDITPNLLGKRAQQLLERRAPGHYLVFIVDEAGQYVGRSTMKMLNLQGVVEAAGKVGRGRIWVVVTSQERLDEVVSNLDGTRVEFAKLQDRFPIQIDLRPSDISEVTSKRVLSKKPAFEDLLSKLYEEHKGALGSHTSLQDTTLMSELSARRFVQMYPFVPYQVDLAIRVISGLRTQGGATRHVSGSNRTIIKLAQQVIIHPEVQLGSRKAGALVTLDIIYDLVRASIGQERQLDIDEVARTFGRDAWETKLVKALCLLDFARGVPRTVENLAAVLYPHVGSPSIRPQLEKALEELKKVQKVRQSDQGWELLSAEGKKWETERQSIMLAGRELTVMKKKRAGEVFRNVGSYRYKGLRSFGIELWVNGEKVTQGDGDVALRLRLPPENCDQKQELDAARDSSRRDENSVLWVTFLSDHTYSVLTELHRSTVMLERHGRERSGEQPRLLTDERSRQQVLEREVNVHLQKDLLGGTIYFGGVEYRASDYGATLEDVVPNLLAEVAPKIYSKFDLVAVPLKGKEAEAFITNANLSGLPQVCYEGQNGLGLVKFVGGTYIVNPDAQCAQEILAYVEANSHSQSAVTGKALETAFRARPYGWTFEAITVIVAALFRSGRLEITFQGRRVTNITDHGAREVFATAPAFRSAGFAPRQGPLDLEALRKAHQTFTKLYGHEAPLEEGGLAKVIRDAVRAERDKLVPLSVKLRTLHLPGAQKVEELTATLKGIADSNSEDAIKTFALESPSLLDWLEKTRVMNEALTDEAMSLIVRARRMVVSIWPSMWSRLPDDHELGKTAERVNSTLQVESWPERLAGLTQDVVALEEAYTGMYREIWGKRAAACEEAVDEVRSFPGFDGLPDLTQEEILRPFLSRAGHGSASGEAASAFEGPSLKELETDIVALPALKQEAIAKCAEATAPSKPVARVKAKRFFGPTVSDKEELEQALGLLKTECLKLLQEGKLIVIE